jgi:hypothetical protein
MPGSVFDRPKRDRSMNRAFKGIVGYRGMRPSMMDMEYPLKLKTKDHSNRPTGSTKRLGRKRGPGGGGVQGAMRNLRDALDRANAPDLGPRRGNE